MLNIAPLPPDQVERALPLLAAYPYKPYRGYAPDYGEDAVTRQFVDSLRSRLAAEAGLPPELRPLWAVSDGTPVGLLLSSRLDVESRHLGFPAIRIELLTASGAYAEQRAVKTALVTAWQELCATGGAVHLSVRLDAADWSGVHALEALGFILVDGLLGYRRALQPGIWLSTPPVGYAVRAATGADLPAMKALAASSYVHDRLHVDPAFPPGAAGAVFAAWLEASCAPGSGDAMWVAEDHTGVIGYLVCRLIPATSPYFGEPIGFLVVVATAPQARGRGVARSFGYTTCDWVNARGARFVEVGTQLHNFASARLQESCGFRLFRTSLSLSKLIERRAP